MVKFYNQPEIPFYEMKVSYDVNGRQEYIGVAFPGAATSDARWSIYKMGYDANGRMVTRRYANATDDFVHIWDSHTTYDYLDI